MAEVILRKAVRETAGLRQILMDDPNWYCDPLTDNWARTGREKAEAMRKDEAAYKDRTVTVFQCDLDAKDDEIAQLRVDVAELRRELQRYSPFAPDVVGILTPAGDPPYAYTAILRRDGRVLVETTDEFWRKVKTP